MKRTDQKRLLPAMAALPAFLGPKGLRGTPAEPMVVVLGTAVLALVFLAEVATPRDVTFSPYAFLVVVVCAWLMGPRALALVVFAAALGQALRPLFNNATWLTVVVNWVALGGAAALGHVAGSNTAEARQSREQELAVLLETARQLNHASGMHEVLDTVARAAAASSTRGAPRATIWLLEGERLRALEERDVRGPVLGGRDFELTPAVKAIFETRTAREVRVEQLDTELRGLLAGHRVLSLAMAPVMIGGRPFGALSAAARDEDHFAPPQLAILAGLADLAGIAIARARELEGQRSRARVLELLHEVLLATASAAAPEDVAQRVVDEARSMLGASTVALALRDRERPGLWIKAATRPLALAAVAPESTLGRAYTRATPAVAAAEEWAESPGDADIAGQAAQLLVAPVLAGQDCLGVIAAAMDATAEDSTHLLALLGSQLGSAVVASELRGELVESARVFRSLCAGLGCAAVLHDAAGRTVEVNWAAESMTGVSVQQITSDGIFGPTWSLKTENGAELPPSMRPPRYVTTFDRPLLGLVAEVTGPGGRPVWLRIDSNPILERGRLKWIVTTFYPVPAPTPKTSSRTSKAKKISGSSAEGT
jgi:GAF domain-containing protein